ncbi:hypothetical protein BT63DRAFT_456590 [Microthyrium microscopicum]|uniref:Sensor histidine kinase/response regulator n=1 Tax=Microthyrium microscopicum TaxID=703497 RepID=A0A6A6U874_9PEZI|nr:hypothetical protein BT63DRAFT_456590 [Microthyrium microscopicum]
MASSASEAVPATNKPAKKAVSENKRQQNVHRYNDPNLLGVDLTEALSSLDVPLPPRDHIPKAATDSVLTSLAQLAAIKLGVSRALISLIDGHRQCILAEATPRLSLGSTPSPDGVESLWLGNAIIPRNRGLCTLLLDSPDINPIPNIHQETTSGNVVIHDLLKDERYKREWFVHEGPRNRFYAGVPLLSPDGAKIGALCVYSNTPRPGLSHGEYQTLHELADTTMNYLVSNSHKQETLRGEKMMTGLTSFVDEIKATEPVGSSISGPPTKKLSEQSLPQPTPNSAATVSQKPNLEASVAEEKTSKHPTFQEQLLSPGAKSMFSRAASIIRDSCDLDGIAIFDASAVAGRIRSTTSGKAETLDKNSSASSHLGDSDSGSGNETPKLRSNHPSHQKSEQNPKDWFNSPRSHLRKLCDLLSFAGRTASAENEPIYRPNDGSLTEADLKKMLELYPKGGIFNFDGAGNLSSTEDSDSTLVAALTDPAPPATPRRRRKKTIGEAIQSFAPGSRSVFLLPLWNYERGRWFAMCLGWTTDSQRALFPDFDMMYLRAFGNTIMTEVSRLDAIATSNSKATFVQSISHELRSPLHGILGGVHFLQETPLSAFQQGMLSSIEMSGRTLLDTVEHVLDYSKINDIRNSKFGNRKKYPLKPSRKGHVKLRRKKLPSGDLQPLETVDITLCMEEVIEAVFAGASYRTMSTQMEDSRPMAFLLKSYPPSGGPVTGSQQDAERRNVWILLDMPHLTNTDFVMAPGAWRRIIMNIFGNSVKFTHSGYIRLSLELQDVSLPSKDDEDSTDTATSTETVYQEKRLILTISDSGIGMSDEFLANGMFKPFSQENSFYAGTGLGMSIVQQLVESIGGTISVRSKRSFGTDTRVELPLFASNRKPVIDTAERQSIAEATERMRGQRVCILEPKEVVHSAGSQSAVAGLGQLLVKQLKEWLSIDAFLAANLNDVTTDFVICVEPSFDTLSIVRSRSIPERKTPVVVFLALDAIEASALRNDVRVLDQSSIVEIIAQPCGPFKLARTLGSCLDRQQSAELNRPGLERQNTLVLRQADQPSASRSSSTQRKSMAQTVPPTKTEPATKENTNGPYVLVVDDNQINRRLLIALMNNKGYPHMEAFDGQDALNKFKDSPRPFDVVLMDTSMPIMDGNTATREIRTYEQTSDRKRAMIVAVTGLASTSARMDAISSGADHYLTKPLKFKALLGLLEDQAGSWK